jgi:hypothetical protein
MEKQTVTRPFTWLLFRMRPVFRWFIRLRSSPAAIAGGFALGVFIAFTPTIGLQVILAIILATMANVNRPAAVMSVWLTNPVTIPVVFTFNYWVGSLILPGPSVSTVSHHLLDLATTISHLDVWEIKHQLGAVSRLGMDIICPLVLGSVIVGAICALLTYFLVHGLLEFFLSRRKRRRESNRS